MDAVAYALAKKADLATVSQDSIGFAGLGDSGTSYAGAVDIDNLDYYRVGRTSATFQRKGIFTGTTLARTNAPYTPTSGATVTWRRASTDGEVWINGGQFTNSKELYVYDINLNSWTAKTFSPAYARKIHGFTWDPVNDYLWRVSDNQALQRYDPTGNTWSVRASPSFSNTGYVASTLAGLVYASTDSTTGFAVYDNDLNTWTDKAAAPFAGMLLIGTGNKVALLGGGQTLGYTYDPDANAYTQVITLPSGMFAPLNVQAMGQGDLTEGYTEGGGVSATLQVIQGGDHVPEVVRLLQYLATI